MFWEYGACDTRCTDDAVPRSGNLGLLKVRIVRMYYYLFIFPGERETPDVAAG